ncbi:MAG: hypothetical protein H6819_10545 [Phycisphaerales bacterium]|nr:hypothetical protein [Phycisphaerales bacterium]MCB9855933.1 hypothetical protein [Phycisphaerales bacterium]MCB9864086.1 hypothetical protein [Phycisphaerales bacterium]
MKARKHLAIGSIIAVLAMTSISAIAGSMNWSEKPVLTSESDAGPLDQPMLYEYQVWKDGSAVFKITPMAEFPEDMLPARGMITVNDKSYKMSVRKDDDEKQCLFGSVPVDTFALDRDITFTLEAYDSRDVLITEDWFQQIVE